MSIRGLRPSLPRFAVSCGACLFICLHQSSAEAVEAVIYTALRPAHWDLYSIDNHSESPKRLTSDADLDYNATLSPDGRWLVFTSERRGNPDLFVIDLRDGGPPRLLFKSDAMEDAATISADGEKLALVCTKAGNADICLAPFEPTKTLDSSEIENLTDHSAGDFNPAFSPDRELIAFSSSRDELDASEIYLMKSDGTEVRRLTDSDGWDGSPVWSQDGSQIYFYSQRDGRPRIYCMKSDGSDERPVTANGYAAVSPTISPKGRLAYTASHAGRWRIESAKSDGSDVRIESPSTGDFWAPAFHPRTNKLFFHGTASAAEMVQFDSGTPGRFLANDQQRVSLPDRELAVVGIRGYFPATCKVSDEIASDEGFHRIVISGRDGTNMRTVFQRDGQRSWRPTWSKDGTWLACSVGRTFSGAQSDVDIWKFKPDGSEAMNLTKESVANNGFPDFSPNGQQLVFRSGRDGNHEIYVMDSDGANVIRLTNNSATDTMPAFDPDGKRIAFTSNRTGDYEIYIVDVTESGEPGKLRRVTNSEGRDTHPKFSPDGKWLVFASARSGLNDETPLIPVFNPQPYGEIYVMRINDGHVARLTHNKWEDGTPTWAISSRQIRKANRTPQSTTLDAAGN